MVFYSKMLEIAVIMFIQVFILKRSFAIGAQRPFGVGWLSVDGEDMGVSGEHKILPARLIR